MINKSKAFIFVFFVLILLPLLHFSNAIYGYETPKILVFRVLVQLLLLNRILSKTKHPTEIPINLFSVSLYSFVGFMVFSSFFSVSPFFSFFSGFERMDGVLDILHYLVFCFLVFDSKIELNDVRKVIFFSCFVSFVISILAIYQGQTNDYFRSNATFGNPITLSFYLIIHIYLVLFIFHKKHILLNNNRWSALYFLILIISLVVGLYFTGTRSAFLSLGIGLIIYSVLMIPSLFKYTSVSRLRTIGLAAIIIAPLLFLAIYFSSKDDYLMKRILNFSGNEGSINSRLLLWEVCLNNSFVNPFFGWGKETFVYFFAQFYDPRMHPFGFWYDRAHNAYFDKLIEFGFPGFVLFVVVFISFIVITWRLNSLKRRDKVLVSSFITSLLIYYLTNFDSFITYISLFTLFGFVLQQSNYKPLKLKFNKYLWAFTLLIIVLLLKFYSFDSIRTYVKWNRANNMTSINEIITAYDDVYSNSLIGQNDIAINFSLKREQINAAQIDNEVKKLYFENSERYLKNSLVYFHDNPIILSHLGLIQKDNDKLQEAIETYVKLKEIAPKRQANLMDLGVIYLKNKDLKSAQNMFEYTSSLDSTYHQSKLYLAYVLSLQNEKKKVYNILGKIPDEFLLDNIDMLSRVFSNTNDFNLYNQMFYRFNNYSLKCNTYLTWLKVATIVKDQISIQTCLLEFYMEHVKRETPTGSNAVRLKNFENELMNGIGNPDNLLNLFPNSCNSNLLLSENL